MFKSNKIKIDVNDSNNIDEKYICELVIGFLSNIDSENYENKFFELEDKICSFEQFCYLLYNNHPGYFSVNKQNLNNELLTIIGNVKENHKKLFFRKNAKLSIIDNFTKRYINKFHTAMPNQLNIKFLKDVNNFTSLADFDYVFRTLSLDDIINHFYQYYNYEIFKYFRFKVIVNYYSSDLQENISIACNYLVEIPSFLTENFDVIENIKNIIDNNVDNNVDVKEPNNKSIIKEVEDEKPKVNKPKIEEVEVEKPKVNKPKIEEIEVEKPKVNKPKIEEVEDKNKESIKLKIDEPYFKKLKNNKINEYFNFINDSDSDLDDIFDEDDNKSEDNDNNIKNLNNKQNYTYSLYNMKNKVSFNTIKNPNYDLFSLD